MSKGTFIMAIVKIRKLVTTVDEIHSEMGEQLVRQLEEPPL